MSKVLKIICGVFLGLGLLFLILGAGMRFGFEASVQDYVQVTGRIVSFSRDYPVVGYELNGYEGELRSHSRSSWQRIGDPVTLWVDPNDPSRASDGSLLIIGLVFLIIGGCTMLVPGVIVVVDRAAQSKLTQLYAYGRRIQVTVTDVKQNYMVSLNNRHPWRIAASVVHPFTGETITVHSRNLWKTSVQPGDRVDVLFDPMNEKRYAMDVKEDA